MGSLLTAVALFDRAGLAAALYYAIHSTLIAAALFLLAEIVAARRGASRDLLVPAPPVAGAALLGGLFFLAGIAMAGLPPLSGFAGKLLILDAVRAAPGWGWIWAVLLATSLLVMIGFARAGSTLFWKSEAIAGVEPYAPPKRADPPLATAAAAALLAGTAALSLFAGPVMVQVEATAAQLMDPRAYVSAVLGPERAAAALPGAR
jgi:multicomponent K+:H+ antiporter subunit D